LETTRKDNFVSYSLPDLPYDYGELEPHYDARTLELHHSKHHASYVAKASVPNRERLH
jgi:Fe-Mn family superoxide dismutase